jgi:hypothetical protein
MFTKSESYITTDGQSASLSWNKASVWGLWLDFYYCQTFVGMSMWGALSDERTGLPFTIAPGPRRYSHFRFRVLCYPWPYYTVSDSRLPFMSPPTTPRVTVKVFYPTITTESYWVIAQQWTSLLTSLFWLSGVKSQYIRETLPYRIFTCMEKVTE